jgi:hypothetical protein
MPESDAVTCVSCNEFSDETLALPNGIFPSSRSQSTLGVGKPETWHGRDNIVPVVTVRFFGAITKLGGSEKEKVEHKEIT